MRMCQQLEKYSSASACPDVNTNANANVNATNGSINAPISTNANENAIEQTGTLNLLHRFEARRHSHTTYHVYGILVLVSVT